MENRSFLESLVDDGNLIKLALQWIITTMAEGTRRLITRRTGVERAMQGPKGQRQSPEAYSVLMLVVEEGRSRSRSHSNQMRSICNNIEVRAEFKLVDRPKDSKEQAASQETLMSSLGGVGWNVGGRLGTWRAVHPCQHGPLRLAPIRRPSPRNCQDFSLPRPAAATAISILLAQRPAYIR